METKESPLEVLSRAATMLQESFNGPIIEDDPKLQNTTKQLPTSKWKRDRRGRAEYSRKSEDKLGESFLQKSEQLGLVNQEISNNYITNLFSSNGYVTIPDTPIDMSIRQRRQPPSYDQTVSNPSYRSNHRVSVIMDNGNLTNEDIPSGMSMCDPIIDEHFRRSLGKDYLKVFSNCQRTKTGGSVKNITLKKQNGVVEPIDNSGLSVDDHFAKALGDTWVKLNNKGSNSADKGTVLSV